MDGGSEIEMGREEDKVSWCVVRGRSPENPRRVHDSHGECQADRKGTADKQTVFSTSPQASPGDQQMST